MDVAADPAPAAAGPAPAAAGPAPAAAGPSIFLDRGYKFEWKA